MGKSDYRTNRDAFLAGEVPCEMVPGTATHAALYDPFHATATHTVGERIPCRMCYECRRATPNITKESLSGVYFGAEAKRRFARRRGKA